MRRNLVFFSIVWALVLMLSASCATKNGIIITNPVWLGPNIAGITIAPAGPYYVGDAITVTVAATAANAGTLTYAWTITGTWGTITGGADTAAVNIDLDAVGTAVGGEVVVTETVGEGVDAVAKTAERTFSLDVLAALNAAPRITSLEATGNALTATFIDDDGDNLTVSWAATAGTVTPGAATNTTADATFVPPAGTGTATITLTVADAFADDTATVDIGYVLDPFAGVASDTIFLYAPVTSIATGAFTYVFVGANVAAAKPLANLNAVRLLVANTQLLVTEIGCLTTSDVNLLFNNAFASAMAGDAVSGGDALFTAFSGFDAWAGFADQTGIALLASPPLPQATFTDCGINWGNNTMEKTGTGFITVVKFRGTGAGAATIEIQGRDAGDVRRTFYSDLATNQYEFATIGAPVTITVG